MAKITIGDVQRAVGLRYKVSRDDMVSARRPRPIARPRQIAMFLTREMTKLSLPAIGAQFGGRDHTTVVHACKVIPRIVLTSEKLQADLAYFREIIPLMAQEREERELQLRNIPLSWNRGQWEPRPGT